MPQPGPEAVALPPPSVPSAEWLAQFARSRGIPLPQDLRIIPPDPNVPREFARFSGVWGGDNKWNGRCRVVLVVIETVDALGRATVVHSEGPGEAFCYGPNQSAWSRRFNATIRGGTMAYTTSPGLERRFTLISDNQLSGITVPNPNLTPPYTGATISISRLN